MQKDECKDHFTCRFWSKNECITNTRLLILFAHWAPHTCVVLTMQCHVSPDLQHLCLKIFCFDSHSGCKMLQAMRGGKKKRKHCSSHGKVERLIWIKVVALNGRIE